LIKYIFTSLWLALVKIDGHCNMLKRMTTTGYSANQHSPNLTDCCFSIKTMDMTMLQSYEAIYEHGAIRGLGEKPSVNQAHVIVTILDVSVSATAPLRTNKQPSPLIAGKGSILTDLTLPISAADEWPASHDRARHPHLG
jgi:hypothetical protein